MKRGMVLGVGPVSPSLAAPNFPQSSSARLFITGSGEVSSLKAVSMRNRSESSAAIGIPHAPLNELPYIYSFELRVGR